MEPKYEYEIIVENKVVWRGLNPEKAYDEIRKKNPGKKVGIAWRTKEDILVCVVI
jgi:hypothetical protein